MRGGSDRGDRLCLERYVIKPRDFPGFRDGGITSHMSHNPWRWQFVPRKPSFLPTQQESSGVGLGAYDWSYHVLVPDCLCSPPTTLMQSS